MTILMLPLPLLMLVMGVMGFFWEGSRAWRGWRTKIVQSTALSARPVHLAREPKTYRRHMDSYIGGMIRYLIYVLLGAVGVWIGARDLGILIHAIFK